jgi:hypothetical protein
MDRKHKPPADTAAETGAREGPAAGTVDRPIPPDQAQPGDRSELGANLGGPVDVFPGPQSGAVDHRTPDDVAHQNRPGPTKRRR